MVNIIELIVKTIGVTNCVVSLAFHRINLYNGVAIITVLGKINTGSTTATLQAKTHQAVYQTQGGLSKGGHDGIGNTVAKAGLDEASGQEVGDGNQPAAIRREGQECHEMKYPHVVGRW